MIGGCTIAPDGPTQVTETEVPFEIRIGFAEDIMLGFDTHVDIIQTEGAFPMGGFDFLIGYDAYLLLFREATLSEYLAGCGWEYFTYRYPAIANCGDQCPSGLLRIFGMADTNNGTVHPDLDCIDDADLSDEKIATLHFRLTNDRTYECRFSPIQFFWQDCGDNAISSSGGDTLAIGRFIFDKDSSRIDNRDFGFPGFYGPPDDSCLAGDINRPIRAIDFINGGVQVICFCCPDARGDINVNGVLFEMADAVMFIDYFINGLSAFGNHLEASIAASDVNWDGISLHVSDFVYLVRKMFGTAIPLDQLNSDMTDILVTTQLYQHRSLQIAYEATADIGALWLTFEINGEIGEPIPGDGVEEMDLKYGVNDDRLHILIYNIGEHAIPAGEHTLLTIPVEGTAILRKAEASDYEGAAVDVTFRVLPGK
jgi:hypothetical protein